MIFPMLGPNPVYTTIAVCMMMKTTKAARLLPATRKRTPADRSGGMLSTT